MLIVVRGTAGLVLKPLVEVIWIFSNGHVRMAAHGIHTHVIGLLAKVMWKSFGGLWIMDVNGAQCPVGRATKLRYYNWRMNIMYRIMSPVDLVLTKSAVHFLWENMERRGRRGILDYHIIGKAMASKEVNE